MRDHIAHRTILSSKGFWVKTRLNLPCPTRLLPLRSSVRRGSSGWTFSAQKANLVIWWRGTQVVRERSAKPLYVGSIPTRASNSHSDRMVITIGSYSATGPLSAAANWVMQMATFKRQ